MEFLVLRVLTHSELGMFHEYRRQGKEGSKQRAVNFDSQVVARVFPGAVGDDRIDMDLQYLTDEGSASLRHWLKRQEKNWRLEGNCPKDRRYGFVCPGCLFVMKIDAGVSPSVGAWTVFPAESEVTRRILTDPASAGLAGAGMIALHGAEGAHLENYLAAAAPELFGATGTLEGQMVTRGSAQSDEVDGGVKLPPRGNRVTEMLGDVGHTLSSAVAEIVDNAVVAQATCVKIIFGRPDQGHGRWMTIADNGEGMTWAQLKEAMRIGSDTTYSANSLGKYGYGLKGASWSQAAILTVVTRTAGGETRHLTWDKSSMDDEWIASTEPLEPWAADATRIEDSGTVVLWRNMTPPLHTSSGVGISPYAAEIRDLDRHIALVFHRFLEGKVAGRRGMEIQINGTPVEPNNPVAHPLVKSYDGKTIRMPTPTGDASVEVRGYLLPHEDEIKAHHAAEGSAAVERALDRIGLHGRRNETQGLFIYRNDRLIRWGGWHEMWATNDEKTKLARVIVDFGPALDKAFDINISKQIVRLPKYLQDGIKPLANFARKDSQAKYRRANVNPTAPRLPPSVVAPAAPTNGRPEPQQPEPSTPSPPQPPRVTIRPVTQAEFIWEVSTNLAGGQELRVNDRDQDLSELARLVASHPQAVYHLTRFLERLDDAGAQELILAQDP